MAQPNEPQLPHARHAQPATPARHARHAAGKLGSLLSLACLVLAVAGFAVLDTTTKWVTAEVPLGMALWALFLVQVLVYSLLLVLTGRVRYLRAAAGPAQWWRGLLLLAVQLLAFLSLHYLPVGEFTAVAMTTPLVVTLLAGRFLGEQVSWVRVLLVLGGLAGTLVIARPGGAAFGWALLLPLLLVAVNVAYQLLTSWMARTHDALVTLFYTSAVALLAASLPLPWYWTLPLDAAHVGALLLMGLAASSANLLFVKAFERDRASSLMPYMYLQIGFGILGGWVVFDHVPDALTLAGMALIAGCGVVGGLLTLHEHRH